MARSTGFSAQTLRVLASLESDPVTWRHGYLLAGETGLRAATLDDLGLHRRRTIVRNG